MSSFLVVRWRLWTPIYSKSDLFVTVDINLRSAFQYGIIHLIHTQNFPKNEHLLLPDTQTYVCVSNVKKC